MPIFTGQFASIVLLGKHNPQILSHDFLVGHNILPHDSDPFRDLLSGDVSSATSPFTEFVSTPVISSIRYDTVSIVMDPTRFQITDRGYFDHPENSVIVEITKRFFGQVLKYTPVHTCGVNVNGRITFNSPEEECLFDARLGIDRNRVETLAPKAESLRIGMTVRFGVDDQTVELQVSKPRDVTESCDVNLNIESKTDSIEQALERVAELDELHHSVTDLLKKLGVEEMK